MTRIKFEADGTTEVQQIEHSKHVMMEKALGAMFSNILGIQDFFVNTLRSIDPECAKMIDDELKEFLDGLKTACESLGYEDL
jgi:hypothetical protein